MKRIGFLLGVVVIMFFVSQYVCFKLDDRANSEFAAKAKAQQIKGRPKDFVRSIFDEPAYKAVQGDRTIWVYTPGPSCALWRHECKIGFDSGGLVDGWSVRSD